MQIAAVGIGLPPAAHVALFGSAVVMEPSQAGMTATAIESSSSLFVQYAALSAVRAA